MELEVPPKEALEAGNAVQWYVLAKTARRRIRNYLRNHDSIWLKDLRLGEFGAEDLGGGFGRRNHCLEEQDVALRCMA